MIKYFARLIFMASVDKIERAEFISRMHLFSDKVY